MQSAFALSPSMASLALPQFSTLFHKRNDCRLKVIALMKAPVVEKTSEFQNSAEFRLQMKV